MFFSSNTGGGYLGHIKVTDTKAQNTNGGAFAHGAWRTRVLNTEDTDSNDDCVLNANQITLVAGTYECHISVPAYEVDFHQAKLYNVTGSVDILLGSNGFCAGGGAGGFGRSVIIGRFTIAENQALEVQHKCNTTRADYGYGIAGNYNAEVYTIAEFHRVS